MSDLVCFEGIDLLGEFQPCNLPAVAVRIDPEDGNPYPVCKLHVRGEMVGLGDLLTVVGAMSEGWLR